MMQKLEAEMKLLKWHKLANETALQTALMRTKQMRQDEKTMKPKLEEVKRRRRKERLRKAEEEEWSKSLVQSLNSETSKQTQEEKEREEDTIKIRRTHLLLTAKQKIDEREELKSRKDFYRDSKARLLSQNINDASYTKEKLLDNNEGISSTRNHDGCSDGRKDATNTTVLPQSKEEQLRQVVQNLQKLPSTINDEENEEYEDDYEDE